MSSPRPRSPSIERRRRSMERLWAPWRMEYITGEQPPGCLFCRVLENPDDRDAELVVWRPPGAIVMLNKFPYNAGHVMVAPAAHDGRHGAAVLDHNQVAKHAFSQCAELLLHAHCIGRA